MPAPPPESDEAMVSTRGGPGGYGGAGSPPMSWGDWRGVVPPGPALRGVVPSGPAPLMPAAQASQPPGSTRGHASGAESGRQSERRNQRPQPAASRSPSAQARPRG